MTTPLISVICCAHNEEKYVDRSVPRMLHALKGLNFEIVFVADRCRDTTVEKVRKYELRLIEKNWKKWENGYAESLQTGLLNAKGVYVAIVDADIIVPAIFFRVMMPMVKGNLASVAAHLVTYPDTLWNRLMYAWEKTYSIAPMGKGHRGAARVISKKALDEIDGFRDVFTTDTDMDIRLAKRGYKSVTTSAVRVYHIRHMSPRTIVNGQIRMGQGRYMIGYSFVKTMGHAMFRFRPYLLGGWLMEWMKRKND